MPFNSFDDFPMTWQPTVRPSSVPLYKALAEKLMSDVSSGLLRPGTKLPPQRELADFMDISLSTVTKAFKLCENWGIISATVGNGTYVCFDISAGTYLLPEKRIPLFDLGNCHPASGYDLALGKHIKDITAESAFADYFQYGGPVSTQRQRSAGAQYITMSGYEVDADRVLISGGCHNGLLSVLASLFHAGDKIGTTPTTYAGLKSSAKMLGIQLVPLIYEGDEISQNSIQYAIKNSKIKALFLTPDFQSATTHTMSLENRKSIAHLIQKSDLLLLEDAVFSLMNPEPLPPISSFAPEQAIYFTSLSKTVASGLRIGYIVPPARYYEKISSALYNVNLCVSPFMAELATNVILSGDAACIIETHREEMRYRNAIVDRVLGCFHPRGTPESMFRWLELPPIYSSGADFEFIAFHAGVQVFSAERFAVGKISPPNAIRIAVSTSVKDKDFERGLVILHSLLSGRSNSSIYPVV